MINRQEIPHIASQSILNILPYSKKILSNGIEVIIVHDATQEVFKVDVIFNAGTNYQSSPLIASTTINMLNEGTSKHSAKEIAEAFDYYGAYADFNCGMKKAEINLIALNKYAKEMISIVAEIIKDSIFPEKELEIYLRNKRQQYLVNIEKTDTLARKEFARLLFGEQHPYANTISEKDYTQVDANAILRFYQERINARNCQIILSGNVSETVLAEIENNFSSLSPSQTILPEPLHQFTPAPAGRYRIQKKGAVQASIRIGKKGVMITDDDYPGFQVLNTILGGYFGSRLMSNIREEKGYTYGINSFSVTLPDMGYWGIATDVNDDYTEDTIAEILKEIKKLQTELIPEEELSLVKNYINGELLRELDGVFSQSDALKHKLNYGLDNQIYTLIMDKTNRCNSTELMELANKYMNIDELYIVTAERDKN